jgi:hypothetical protein
MKKIVKTPFLWLMLLTVVVGAPFLWKAMVAPAKPKPPATSQSFALPQSGIAKGALAQAPDAQKMPAGDLFIGDSRTVGLQEYGGVEAQFFASVGMSSYSALDETVSVNGEDTTLVELLTANRYRRVFVMLGVNELGYDFDTTVKKYQSLVDQIRELEPKAQVVLEANLHVSAQRSEGDAYVNNPAIDRFNQAIAAMADGKTVRYLDVNGLFDDENGALSTDCTGDGVHLLAKDCARWGAWLTEQGNLA